MRQIYQRDNGVHTVVVLNIKPMFEDMDLREFVSMFPQVLFRMDTAKTMGFSSLTERMDWVTGDQRRYD